MDGNKALLVAVVLSPIGVSACSSDPDEDASTLVCTLAPIVLETLFTSLELPSGIDQACAPLLKNWLDSGNPFSVDVELPDGTFTNYRLPQLQPATPLSQAELDAALQRLNDAMTE